MLALMKDEENGAHMPPMAHLVEPSQEVVGSYRQDHYTPLSSKPPDNPGLSLHPSAASWDKLVFLPSSSFLNLFLNPLMTCPLGFFLFPENVPNGLWSGLVWEIVLNRELWGVTRGADGRRKKQTSRPLLQLRGSMQYLCLPRTSPQSVVDGPAPPWLLDKRHVKVGSRDRQTDSCSPGHTSGIPSSHTPGVVGQAGRGASAGHSEGWGECLDLAPSRS